MVFDSGAAPRERGAFKRWYKAQAEWSEGHSYNDPAVTTQELQAWFHEMRAHFPTMNGPFATTVDDPSVTDYCIGRHVIYSAFSWSAAESAYIKTRELAIKHRVGFYDVSGDTGEGEILFP
jgi:hypothetical protein